MTPPLIVYWEGHKKTFGESDEQNTFWENKGGDHPTSTRQQKGGSSGGGHKNNDRVGTQHKYESESRHNREEKYREKQGHWKVPPTGNEPYNGATSPSGFRST